MRKTPFSITTKLINLSALAFACTAGLSAQAHASIKYEEQQKESKCSNVPIKTNVKAKAGGGVNKNDNKSKLGINHGSITLLPKEVKRDFDVGSSLCILKVIMSYLMTKNEVESHNDVEQQNQKAKEDDIKITQDFDLKLVLSDIWVLFKFQFQKKHSLF